MWNREILKKIMLRAYCDLRLRAAAVSVFAFVWWGILYPELCFTENTYEQIGVVDDEETEAKQADYRDVLSASGNEIIIKSRLWEWLEQKISKE